MNEAAPGADAKEKKGGSPLVKIIIIAVVAGGVLAGAAFFLLPKFTKHEEPKEIVEVVDEHASSKEAQPFGEVYEMEDIVINPAGSRRVFMVSVALEVVDKEKVKEVQRRETLLRDNLMTLFASQPLEVLIDIKYRQAFRARVKKVMDYQLGEGIVTRVFFQKWVFQ